MYGMAWSAALDVQGQRWRRSLGAVERGGPNAVLLPGGRQAIRSNCPQTAPKGERRGVPLQRLLTYAARRRTQLPDPSETVDRDAPTVRHPPGGGRATHIAEPQQSARSGGT